jgi:hypothetical protein
MSWVGDRLGIHVNSINDITSGRAIKEAVHNPLVDAALMAALPGVGSALTGAIGALPGGSAVTGALQSAGVWAGKVLGSIPGSQTFASGLGKAANAAGSDLWGAAKKLGLNRAVPRAADGSIDWGQVAKMGATAIPAIQSYKAANAANKYAQQQRDNATAAQGNISDMARQIFGRIAPGSTTPSTNYLALLKGNRYAPLVQAPAGG